MARATIVHMTLLFQHYTFCCSVYSRLINNTQRQWRPQCCVLFLAADMSCKTKLFTNSTTYLLTAFFHPRYLWCCADSVGKSIGQPWFSDSTQQNRFVVHRFEQLTISQCHRHLYITIRHSDEQLYAVFLWSASSINNSESAGTS